MMEPKVETHLVIVYRVNRFLMAPMEGRNLFEQISRRKERFSTLSQAIETANLTETLKKGKFIWSDKLFLKRKFDKLI